MTNTSIINYTGMKLKIKYYNKKIEECLPDSKLDLEYIINWNFNEFGSKQISIKFDNKNKEFKIPFEKLGYQYIAQL